MALAETESDGDWPGLRRLGHETAGAHMVAGIPRTTPQEPVAVVLDEMRGRRFDCADAVFVVDADERLLGLVHMNDLMAAPGHQPVGEVMEPEHDAVRPDDDQEAVALVAMHLGMVAVPVVGDDGRLLGAVPPQALTAILRREHMEDLQRLAGITRYGMRAVDERARDALDAPLGRRLRRRLPWLVVGLLASSLATLTVAGFREVLEAHVAVAFFVPALVYIAGAIGTQAVSVAVRGLSVSRTPIGLLLRRELSTGLLIGLALGALVVPPVLWAFGDERLALAVGLAVLGAGAVSAVIGLLLPWLFQRAGADPALGSGPICTILQDVVSLLIYFATVSLLLL